MVCFLWQKLDQLSCLSSEQRQKPVPYLCSAPQEAALRSTPNRPVDTVLGASLRLVSACPPLAIADQGPGARAEVPAGPGDSQKTGLLTFSFGDSSDPSVNVRLHES